MDYSEITNKYKALNRLIETLGLSIEDFKGSEVTQSEQYAIMIGKKILNHCISVVNISKSQTYIFSNKTRVEFVDFPSIAVITRSIVESYLAFNHIFINVKSDSESKFKWLVYDFAGYLERQTFKANLPANVLVKEQEAQAIVVLRKEIKANPHFQNFTSKQQKQLLERENWKLFNRWGDLAKAAGYNVESFNQTYKFLCSYVHSGRLSILQILDAHKHGNEINLVNSNINTCCGALAKYINDLGSLIPSLKKIYEKDSLNKLTVDTWVKFGEKI